MTIFDFFIYNKAKHDLLLLQDPRETERIKQVADIKGTHMVCKKYPA